MVFFPVLFSSNLSPNGSGIQDLSLQNLHLFWRDRDFQVVFCSDLFFNLEKIKTSYACHLSRPASSGTSGKSETCPDSHRRGL
jgi:hypothetical protein